MSKWYNNYMIPKEGKLQSPSFQYYYGKVHPEVGYDCWIIYSDGIAIGYTFCEEIEFDLKVVTGQFFNTSNGLWYARGEDGEFVDGLSSKNKFEAIPVKG